LAKDEKGREPQNKKKKENDFDEDKGKHKRSREEKSLTEGLTALGNGQSSRCTSHETEMRGPKKGAERVRERASKGRH